MKQLGGLIVTGSNTAISQRDYNLSNYEVPKFGFEAQRVRVPRLTVASVILDTSESMKEIQDQEKGGTYNGQKTIIELYNGIAREVTHHSSPRHQVALGSFGFNGVIHPWSLPGEIPLLDSDTYTLAGGTPLFDTATDVFNLAKERRKIVTEAHRGIICNLAFMIVCDAAEFEHSERATRNDVKANIVEIMSQPGNLVYGAGIGPGACQLLKDMGVPAGLVKPATSKMNLAALFREFTSMTTAGSAVARRS
jgi:hypothetical protein